MAKKIVLIDHETFTIRRKELFYINELIARGFCVEVWNVTQWFYPQMTIVDTIEGDYVQYLRDISDLKANLLYCNIAETVFIVESFWNWRTRELFKVLSDYRCCTIRIDLYANSILLTPMSVKIKKLFSSLIVRILRSKFEKLLLCVYNKIYKVRGYKYYLSSSAIVDRTHAINHPDYEKWRFDDKLTPIVQGPYAVFCDIYFPDHPDIKNFVGINHKIDGEIYREKLRQFFDFIEAKYKLPVIIAAHPKADYRGDEFGDRFIMKYQTDNLVRYSSLALMHNCNSISYVILNNKPMVLFSTDEYDCIELFKQSLKNTARVVGLRVYNIDQVEYNDISPQCIDEKIVHDYVYTYLTSIETKDCKNIDSIVEIIGSM